MQSQDLKHATETPVDRPPRTSVTSQKKQEVGDVVAVVTASPFTCAEGGCENNTG